MIQLKSSIDDNKKNKQTKQNQTSPLLDQLPRLSGCLPAKSGRHRLVITPQNNYSKTRAGRLTLAAHRLPIHWRDNLSFSPPLYPLPLPFYLYLYLYTSLALSLSFSFLETIQADSWVIWLRACWKPPQWACKFQRRGHQFRYADTLWRCCL